MVHGDAFGRVGGVRLRHHFQRQGGGLDDEVVHRDLDALRLQHLVHLGADSHQLVDLAVDEQGEMRHVLHAVDHTTRHGLLHPIQRDQVVAAVRNAHLRQRQSLARLCGGCSRRRDGGRLSAALACGLHVALDDAAVRTGALDGLQIQAGLGGQTARQRRGEDAAAIVRLRRGRSGRGFSLWSLSLGRFRLSRFGRSFGLLGRRRHGVAGQAGDRGVDLHALGAFRHQNLQHFALIDGFDFHRRLVGLDLGDDVARRDGVADLDVPFGQDALFHRRRQGGHQDIGHAITFFTAATILSTPGRDRASRLAA
ncbi:Uncharacterised protein [Brevundimonas diminuta]|uniref:NAD-specific glutamate dehydrogenase n=1 Tax=Brevundimonas diminuta TaxID=293 RepID=A0A2X1AZL6_BREDI|nr:Uncharacterised protein [Brevundimonas diminuta]